MGRVTAAHARSAVKNHLVDLLFRVIALQVLQASRGLFRPFRIAGVPGLFDGVSEYLAAAPPLGDGRARFGESEATVKELGRQQDGVRVGSQGHGAGAGDAAGCGQFGGFSDVFFVLIWKR